MKRIQAEIIVEASRALPPEAWDMAAKHAARSMNGEVYVTPSAALFQETAKGGSEHIESAGKRHMASHGCCFKKVRVDLAHASGVVFSDDAHKAAKLIDAVEGALGSRKVLYGAQKVGVGRLAELGKARQWSQTVYEWALEQARAQEPKTGPKPRAA